MLFWLAEHLVVDNYWVSYLPIDDKIPFCRFFIIPYCTWHPLLFLMTVYLFFTDAPAFKRFVVYIGLGFGGSIIFCMLFPNGQDLRPAEFAQNDFFIWLVKKIYAADTNTNVLPSMHVIGCAALALACFDAPRLRAKKLHLVMLPLGALISASTVFVKQHSMLDVIAAIPVSVILCLIVYRPFPKLHRPREPFCPSPADEIFRSVAPRRPFLQYYSIVSRVRIARKPSFHTFLREFRIFLLTRQTTPHPVRSAERFFPNNLVTMPSGSHRSSL